MNSFTANCFEKKSGGVLRKPKTLLKKTQIVPEKMLALYEEKKIKIDGEMSTEEEEAVGLSGSIVTVLYKTEEVLS